jgi:hypothetical protein
MKKRDQFRGRDIEKLSAFIDGELSKREISRLETRLAEDRELQQMLRELKATRGLISALPKVRPPQQFTLTEEMAGNRKRSNVYPIFRFATVVAVVAFAVLVGLDAFMRLGLASSRMSPQAPMVLEVQKEVSATVAAEATEEMMLGRAASSAEDAIAGEEDTAIPPGEPSGEGERILGMQETPSAEKNLLENTPVPEEQPLPTVAAEAPAAELPSEAPEAWAGEPTVAAAAPPAVSPTPLIERGLRPEPMTLLHKIEIGLGSAAALLIALTLLFRRLR